MQILVNSNEVREIVLAHIQTSFGLDDSNNFFVEMHDDGSVAVGINEESTEHAETEQRSSGEAGNTRQRRPRRSKAQIAEDERLAAEKAEAEKAKSAAATDSGNSASTQTTSAEVAQASDNAASSAASNEPKTETGSDTNSLGDQPNPEVVDTTEVHTDPQVEVQHDEPNPEAEAPADESASVQEPDAESEAPAVKPAGVSLFANLRKPTNPAS